MSLQGRPRTTPTVALLAEGVDRNNQFGSSSKGNGVALLAEGVDRNLDCEVYAYAAAGRPPRGGRG